MPQFQILSENPSFGAAFGRQFGEGIGKGISGQLNHYLKQKQSAVDLEKQKKEKIEKGRPQARTLLRQTFKQYGSNDAFTPDLLQKAEDLTDQYVQQGFEPIQAADMAYRQLQSGFGAGEQQQPAQESKSPLQSLLDTPITAIGGAITQLPEFLRNTFKPQPERAPETPRNNVGGLLEQARAQGEPAYREALSSLSNQEFMSLPREQRVELSKEIGQISQEEASRSFARGAIPGLKGLENQAQQAGFIPSIQFGSPQGQQAGSLLGGLSQGLGLFGTAQLAPTLAGRAGAAAGLNAGAQAANIATEEKRAPSFGEVGKAAAIGATLQVAPEIIGDVLRFIKARYAGLFKKAPTTAPGGKTPPSIKRIEAQGPKAAMGEAAAPNAPVSPDVSTEQAIMENAVRNLEKRGINLQAINSGDPAIINALKSEADKTAKLFQAADKMNLKEFNKIRSDISKKIVESPLAEHYKVKDVAEKRPETLAKEELRNAPLRTLIKQNERRARDLQYQVISSDEELRNAKLSDEERRVITATRAVNAFDHQKALNEIRAANFEMKYGRPPQTTAQIQEQIEDTFNQLREGITNPTAPKVERFRKENEKVKDLIETANKLVQRGELPGPEVFDEFIKVHQEYNKAYSRLMSELRDFIDVNKAKPRMKTKVKNAQDLLEVVRKALEAGEAKVIKQIDKRKAMNILDKPSGNFYKQMLPELRNQVAEFQKDLFQWKQIHSPLEAKTAQVGKEKITPFKPVQPKAKAPEADKAKKASEQAEEAIKNPSGKAAEDIGKEANATKEEVKDFFSKMRDKWEKVGEKVKSGKATNEDIDSVFKELKSIYAKFPKLAKSVVNGIALGTLQALAEEYLNISIPASLIIALVPGRSALRFGTAGLTYKAHSYVSNLFEQAEAKKLKSYQNTPKFNEHHRSLIARYDETKAKRIVKKMRKL